MYSMVTIVYLKFDNRAQYILNSLSHTPKKPNCEVLDMLFNFIAVILIYKNPQS